MVPVSFISSQIGVVNSYVNGFLAYIGTRGEPRPSIYWFCFSILIKLVFGPTIIGIGPFGH